MNSTQFYRYTLGLNNSIPIPPSCPCCTDLVHEFGEVPIDYKPISVRIKGFHDFFTHELILSKDEYLGISDFNLLPNVSILTPPQPNAISWRGYSVIKDRPQFTEDLTNEQRIRLSPYFKKDGKDLIMYAVVMCRRYMVERRNQKIREIYIKFPIKQSVGLNAEFKIKYFNDNEEKIVEKKGYCYSVYDSGGVDAFVITAPNPFGFTPLLNTDGEPLTFDIFGTSNLEIEIIP